MEKSETDEKKVGFQPNWKKLYLVGCVLFLAITMSIFKMTQYINSYSGTINYTIAEYEDGYFDEGPTYTSFFTNGLGDGNKIAKVYIESPNKRQFFLPEFTEEEAMKSLGGPGNMFYSTYGIPPKVVHSDGNSIFSFIEGKLTSALISGFSGFGISPRKEGPYLKLPATREGLVKYFGEPLQWRKASKQIRP